MRLVRHAPQKEKQCDKDFFFVYKLFEFQVEKETWARKLVKHF